MKALILAAGSGSNLFPLTETRPKPMINICGKPVLGWILEKLREVGCYDIDLVIGHEKSRILEYLGEKDNQGLSINFVYQDSPLGIGDAIFKCRKHFVQGEHFLLVYGDIVVARNIFSKALLSFGTMKAPIASICLAPSSQEYGNIYMNREVKITKIIEKPARRDLGNYVLAGVFILPYTFFDLLEQSQGQIENAFDLLIHQEGLYASIWEDEWIDIGYPWNILIANRIIMNTWEEAHIKSSVKLEGTASVGGSVFLDENVLVKSGATIQGPCYIGPNCFIGNNVLVRPFTSIGAGSVIGYGVELKNCVIFEGCEVGRLSFIGDSVIGSEVSVGSGVMTINRPIEGTSVKVKIREQVYDSELSKLGAFIGDKAIIGASNTLPPGCVIPAKAKIPHRATLEF